MGILAEIISSILLFGLVYGMSATVQVSQLLVQVRNCRALLVGCCMQFILLPFIGFCCIHIFNLPLPVGITLMVVTSSPGGSYSNWWCSVFNAELALSVTMTAISTLLSTIMLPLNLYIYSKFTYSAQVVQNLDWNALFISLCVVIGGITCGIISSIYGERTGQSIQYHKFANRLGNTCGIALISVSIIVSIIADNSNKGSSGRGGGGGAVWNQQWTFYFGCGLPVIFGLCIVSYITSKIIILQHKPERVATAIESCYQNTGIATSVALTMFSSSSSSYDSYDTNQQQQQQITNLTNTINNAINDISSYDNQTYIPTLAPTMNSSMYSTTDNNDNNGTNNDLALALGVPLFYGIVEAVSLAIYCLICWKISWTKAPANASICTILTTSYEVSEQEHLNNHTSNQQTTNTSDDNNNNTTDDDADEECMSSVEMNTRQHKDDDDDENDNNDTAATVNNNTQQNGSSSSNKKQEQNGHTNIDDSEISEQQQQQRKTNSPLSRRPVHSIISAQLYEQQEQQRQQEQFDDIDSNNDNSQDEVDTEQQHMHFTYEEDHTGTVEKSIASGKTKQNSGLFRMKNDNNDDNLNSSYVGAVYNTITTKFSPRRIGRKFVTSTTNASEDNNNGVGMIPTKRGKYTNRGLIVPQHNDITETDFCSESSESTTTSYKEADDDHINDDTDDNECDDTYDNNINYVTVQREDECGDDEQHQNTKNNKNNSNRKHRLNNTLSRVRAHAAGYQAASTIALSANSSEDASSPIHDIGSSLTGSIRAAAINTASAT